MNSTSQTFPLICVPNDLFYLIAEYLTNNDRRRLFNTNKAKFFHIKKRQCEFSLKTEYSFKYCQSEVFRNQLLSRVDSKSQQISLNLTLHDYSRASSLYSHHICSLNRVNLHHSFLNLDLLQQLHSLQFLKIEHCSNTTVLPQFKGIKKVHLSNFMRLSDISGLRGVEDVTLINCQLVHRVEDLHDTMFLHLEDCRRIRDFSCLGKQQRLILVNCSIHDIKFLANIPDLRLQGCSGVTDITPLKKVSSLKLIECNGITNIDGLQETKCMVIERCFNISIYPLSNLPIRKLCLRSQGIQDLSSFSSLQELVLHTCNYVVNISMLGNLQYLHLEECKNITSLQGLGSVRKLVVIGLEQLQNLDGLSGEKGNQYVVISRCALIRDFSALQDVRNVEILCCPLFHSFEEVSRVKILTVRMCSKVVNLTGLTTNLQILKVMNCKELKSLEGLKDVPCIEISDCENLSDISSFSQCSKTTRVVLRNCSKITSIKPLRDLAQVTVEGCGAISDCYKAQGMGDILLPSNKSNGMMQTQGPSTFEQIRAQALAFWNHIIL